MLQAKLQPTDRSRRGFALRWLAVVLCLTAAPGAALGQPTPEQREYRIKAAFLYQFSKYVEWPHEAFDSPQAPFVIGVLGAAPFGDALEKISKKKKVGDRSIAFRPLESPDEAPGCHMVFLARDLTAEVTAEVLRAARGSAVLVVSDASGFIDLGGDVQFFLQDNKVRFAFHEGVTERPLRVSSKLLSLSKPAPPHPGGLR